MKTLVIVMAETRAHALTWNSFKERLLEPLNADLALCVRDDEDANAYHAYAKYIVRHAEPNQWEDQLTELAGSDRWKRLLEIPSIWLGGAGQYGSGAILIIYRWLVLKFLQQLEASGNAYDRYILTRSDHYHWLDHPVLDADSVWVPEGEDYGGICDRHMVIPRGLVLPCLQLLHRIINDGDQLYLEMQDRGEWNIERYLAFILANAGIAAQRFPRTMFCVRGPADSTRWSQGTFDQRVNMIVKYPAELDACLANASRVTLDGEEQMLAICRGIPGWMAESELIWIFQNARSVPIGETWVELGCWCGRSLLAAGLGLRDGCKLWGVDYFRDSHGSLTHDEVARVCLKNLRELKVMRPGLEIGILVSDAIVAADRFTNESVHTTFIDANHDYADVASQIKAWKPKITSDGRLCGHDYNIADWPGVTRAVVELLPGTQSGPYTIWDWKTGSRL